MQKASSPLNTLESFHNRPLAIGRFPINIHEFRYFTMRWMLRRNELAALWIFYGIAFLFTHALKRDNRCMKHYYVETIQHPRKECEQKNVLLARCEGYCKKSRTDPFVSFSPILHRPFKYHCTCCRDMLSIMKAVKLRCKGGRVIYATYRYIVKCGCSVCGFR
ncbi:hypothetical protein ScPMuIL_018794 [Solemya velum]